MFQKKMDASVTRTCTFQFFNIVFVYANTCKVRTQKIKLMLVNAGFVHGLKQSP